MGPKQLLRYGFFLLMAAAVPVAVCGSDKPDMILERFSKMDPGGAVTGWTPMTFDKIEAHTRYTLVNDGGRTVLRADSQASASGLVRKLDADPGAYPLLSWEWKVNRVIAKGDVTQKSGDDYPARIYVTFAENPEDLSFFQRTRLAAVRMVYGKTPPSAALAYVWGNRAPVETIHPNPYTDRVQMIVVESGPVHLNQWRMHRRNIVEDFRRAFGKNPPRLSGVAVMTDTDNTGESATAWYGDVVFSRKMEE
ncbi:hypothetical protein DSCW_10960 [Desulfosarcina widdelii]|uniref:DUF3047 domain-containing protein n=1 Tax=Desulfosarcina widdelii TaxID=947919 RepID=A0A5K7Z0A2_9BACT|nr:DUF3047 domain-containing protein [Desulfosarcina widdelii]BBO73679.1 hypothetical protein DSCW_10960 [Desulfosarcina widdelii]